jgi:hypothetical protein
MVSILVHGNSHFTLSGPTPDEGAVLAMARHWCIIQFGEENSIPWATGRFAQKSIERTGKGK